MEVGYLQQIKTIVKSLVLSSPNEITMDNLNRDFRSMEGCAIPYRKLGYQTLESFLRSISDTVRVFGSGPTATVRFVPSEKTDHIHDMILKQKKSRRHRGKGNIQQARHHDNQYSYNNTNMHSFKNPERYSSTNIQFNHSLRASNKYSVKCGVQNLVSSDFRQKFNSKNNNSIRNDVKQSQLSYPSIQSKATSNESLNLKSYSGLKSQIKVNAALSPLQSISKNSHQEKNNSLENKSIYQMDQLENELKKIEEVNTESTAKLATSQRPPHQPATTQPLRSIDTITEQAPSKRCEFFQANDSSEEQLNDVDEAIPEFAANNLVFRVDFPENTVVFGKKIAPYKLPTELKHGSIMGIFISEIHNPFKFWFHVHKENHELDILMHHIERFYTTLDADEFRISHICITPGQVCAAQYNGLWHRAEIISPIIKNNAKVLFADYGTVSEVNIDSIKFLPSMFANIPSQAIRGSLSHIKPRGLHWSLDATNHFLSMCSELLLYAQVSEIDDKNRTIYMVLCDTNGENVVQINKTLVDKGFAFYDEEWQECKIQKRRF